MTPVTCRCSGCQVAEPPHNSYRFVDNTDDPTTPFAHIGGVRPTEHQLGEAPE